MAQELTAYLVMGVSGQPFDVYDQQELADRFAAAVNKAAGGDVVFVLPVPRNRPFSASRDPRKVAETAVRAAGRRATEAVAA